MKEILLDAESKMQKSLEAMENRYCAIWTGRHDGWLDSIKIDFHGAWTPLSKLARIHSSTHNDVTISPYNVSSLDKICSSLVHLMGGMSQAGAKSVSWMTYYVADNNVIHISLPQMSKDVKQSMLNMAQNIVDGTKTEIKTIRHKNQKKLKYVKITDDQEERAGRDLQKLSIKYCDMADDLFEKKMRQIKE